MYWQKRNRILLCTVDLSCSVSPLCKAPATTTTSPFYRPPTPTQDAHPRTPKVTTHSWVAFLSPPLRQRRANNAAKHFLQNMFKIIIFSTAVWSCARAIHTCCFVNIILFSKQTRRGKYRVTDHATPRGDTIISNTYYKYPQTRTLSLLLVYTRVNILRVAAGQNISTYMHLVVVGAYIRIIW